MTSRATPSPIPEPRSARVVHSGTSGSIPPGPAGVPRPVWLDRVAALVPVVDPHWFSRLIANLVSNAIRHTPSEGRVEVAARATSDAIELEVRDECGGITDHDMARVFDVGWRGEAARTPDADAGSGLGLAIVRGIAEAHHGSVSVANASEGCSFLVRLPG